MATPLAPITYSEPTTLLEDLAHFIEYIDQHKPQFSLTTWLMQIKHAYALNALLANPHQGMTERSQMKFYPQLMLFYALLLNSGLYRLEIEPTKGKYFLFQPVADRLAVFQSFTPTEQYMVLLETFWHRTDWSEDLGDGYSFSSFFILPNLANDAVKTKPGAKIHTETHWKYANFVLYLSYFGFWRVEQDTNNKKNYATPRQFVGKNLFATAFGNAFLPVLLEHRPLKKWYSDFVESEQEDDDSKLRPVFFEPFQALFPEGELRRCLPEDTAETDLRPGVYVFKVSLDASVWRRIALDAQHTFDDFHRAIQKAFDFDDDHLYLFGLDGKDFRSKQQINDPRSYDYDNGADEILIGGAGLYPKQHIRYLFDFGMSWRFDCILEEISVDEPPLLKPEIRASHGKNPVQYPSWDDDDDETITITFVQP